MLSRRHFAQQLGAGAFLLPFLSARQVQAAPVAPRNLIIVWSLATNITLWRPTSAPGQPVSFSAATKPLAQIADKVILVDGLTPSEVSETHSTPQALTGLPNATSRQRTSVDQLIAKTLGLPAPLLLGICSGVGGNASQFWNQPAIATNNGQIPPNDDPRSAFAQLFGAATPAPTAGGTGFSLPRRAILDLSAKQIRSLQATLGSEQKSKLDQHLDAIAGLQTSIAGPPAVAAGCVKPTLMTDQISNPLDQKATLLVGDAQRELAVGALGCGLTQVVGIQWGTSNLEFLGGNLGFDEHGLIHTDGGEDKVIQAEQYLSSWFVGLVQKLAAMADPRAQGKTLLDTTLVVWSRDFGHQSPGVHTNYSMPFVLAGASDYLTTGAGGRYFNFGGDNLTSTKGTSHQRLLLNLCEAMGVTDVGDFGTLTGSDKAPLPSLRR